LALVLRNFALWVNENDEIWLVVAFHEKFFRVPKLRFLAGPASLLDEVSRGTQNWSVRAVTISNQSISVTFQTFRPFLVILGPFSAIFGHFWPFWPFWPQIQNCRRLVMWPLKMTAREAEIQWRWFRMSLFRHSGQFRSFGALFGHFWPILALNSRWS
jgi:small-conductance mechanosensitive channel